MKYIVRTLIFAAGALAGSSEPAPLASTVKGLFSTIAPSLPSISAAAASVVPSSPVSNVPGIAFDRIVQIWLENTNYNVSAGDPNMQWLATQGITLTQYYAVTHPSEPNYMAVVGGDYFGLDNDDFNNLPTNISTVVDLLDSKGISWGEYQEHMPYAGFQGFNYSSNQVTYASDYVRKHNPLILFDSVAKNASRVNQIKNFTSFYSDLKAQTLPQWSFITPNMTNDAHDTNITFAGQWAKNFLGPLLNNTYFMNRTLVILTFDENEIYPTHNNIYTVLLGGAIDKSLWGTNDSTFYNHYSTISTVSLNWGLPSLGRWDCDANVLQVVANKTGYKNAAVDTTNLYFNYSYPGPLSEAHNIPGWWPTPNTVAKCASGLGVLNSIVSTWGTNQTGTYNYTNVYPYDANSNNAAGGTPTVGVNDAGSGTTTTSASASASKSNPAAVIRPQGAALLGLASFAALFL